MASTRWKGGAAAVAQVDTVTVGGTAAAGQTYTVTIGVRALVYTAIAGDTNSTIAAALQALLAASAYGEFAEMTWTVNVAVITATANTAGIPFTITSASSGTGTLVTAVSVVNSGPNDIKVAANYDSGSLPATGDSLYLDGTGVDMLWNLDALAAVTLTSLTIASTFEASQSGDGTIGLPEMNTLGNAPYAEYRPRYLQIGATTCTIGHGNGAGSGRIKIDFGGVQTNLLVYGSASGADPDLEAILVKGSHVGNAAVVSGGSVAIAGFGGETAALATLALAAGTNGAPQVRTGAGCTLTTLNMANGDVLLGTAPTTVNKTGGSLVIEDGNATTLNERGGDTTYLGAGTITTLLVGAGGSVDFSQDIRARTITNCTLYAGAALSDPFRTATFTNPITLSQCGLPDVSLDLGKNLTLAPVSL